MSFPEAITAGIASLGRRFPSDLALEWFLSDARTKLAMQLSPASLAEVLDLVRGSLGMMGESPSRPAFLALHALLWEAERRLSPEERSERDGGFLKERLEESPGSDGFEPPSLEEKRGTFLGEFLNAAVRDFRIDHVRPLMAETFDRALPGLRPQVEEMAMLAGFFGGEPDAMMPFRDVVTRASMELPVLAVGILTHPLGITTGLLGQRGTSAFAEAVLHGRVAKMMHGLEESEAFHVVKPPEGIAMLQRRLEATERRVNPGASPPRQDPGLPPFLGGF